MPGLEVLAVVERAAAVTARRSSRAVAPLFIAPSAAVWGELGRLREVSLDLPVAAMPLALLRSLNGAVLRKLALRVAEFSMTSRGGYYGPGIRGLVTDAALAALPLLEEVGLFGVLPTAFAGYGLAGGAAGDESEEAFTGAGLASLPRLASLTLHSARIPDGLLSHAPASLRSLDLSHCSGLTDATFAPPCLAGLTSLTLHNPPATVTSEAFVGLVALEDLFVQSSNNGGLISDATLAVLGSHGRLRCLRCSGGSRHTYSHAVTR